jgi:hypothetical protein
MKVLLVAPPSSLPYVDMEIQRVVTLLSPTLLLGEGATIESFVETTQNDDFDLIWFAGHGTQDGIIMSDGILGGDELTRAVRRSLPAVFINTCASMLTAISLHSRLGIRVIGTITDIDDEDAYRTGYLFAQSLAAGNSISAAYKDAKPEGDAQFIHFNGNMELSNPRSRDETLLIVSRLDDRITAIDNKLEERNKKFCDIISKINMRLDGHDRGINVRIGGSGVASLAASAMFFAAFILLMISDIRHQIGVSTPAALILIAVSVVMSAYFAIHGLKIDITE